MNNSLEREFLERIGQNQGIIHKVCNLYSQTELEKEDLFQDILLQLWRSYAKYKGEAKISTWMYRVALNTAISGFRKKQRRPQTEDGEPYFPTLPERIEDPDKAEKRRFLYQAISTLSEVEKAMILLYLEENSYEEIAAIMGITRNHVGVKLNRIKEKLKRRVKPLFE